MELVPVRMADKTECSQALEADGLLEQGLLRFGTGLRTGDLRKTRAFRRRWYLVTGVRAGRRLCPGQTNVSVLRFMSNGPLR